MSISTNNDSIDEYGARSLDSESSSSSTQELRPEALLADDSGMRKTLTNATGRSLTQQLFLRKTATNFEKEITKRRLLQETQDLEPEQSALKLFLGHIGGVLYPSFIFDKIKSYDSFKIISRTFVCAWICLLFMIIPACRIWLGTAPYLPIILIFIVAPGGRSSVDCFYNGLYILLVALFSWLFSVVSQVISMRVRKISFDSSANFVSYLIENRICSDDPTQIQKCIVEVCFGGMFLEAKSSVINVIATAICIIILFIIRLHNPLLTPVAIMGTISILIMNTYANFFPYLSEVVVLGNTFFKSYGVAIASMFVTSFFLFPVTSQSKILDLSLKQMDLILKYNNLHTTMLQTQRPSDEKFADFSEQNEIMKKVRLLRIPIFIESRFTHREILYSRLTPSDVDTWMSAVSLLAQSTAGMEYFYMNIKECKKRLQYFENTDLASVGIKKNFNEEDYSLIEYKELEDRYKSYKLFLREEADLIETVQKIEDLDFLLNVIDKHFSPILLQLNSILILSRQWMELTNKLRFFSLFPPYRRRILKKLDTVRGKIIEESAIFDSNVDLTKENWLSISQVEVDRNLVLPMVGQASLFSFIVKLHAKSLRRIKTLIATWDEETPNPKLFFPFLDFLVAFWRNPLETISSFISHSSYLNINIPTKERDADSLSPKGNIGKWIARLSRAYVYVVKDTCFLLAVKMSIATCLSNSFAYFPSTAKFYYTHRVVWVPIMLSISVSSDSFDSVYQFIVKVFSTIIGSFFGTVAWYISSGSSKGSYYGQGAVGAVFLFAMAYYRHFSIHLTPMPAIVPCVSVVLVFGTSLQDAKSGLESLHWGLETGIARCIAVIVGCSLAFLISVFPSITPGSKKVRVMLSNIVKQIAQLHCEVNNEAIKLANGTNSENSHSMVASGAMKILLATSSTLSIIKRMKYDLQLKGKWPKGRYTAIVQAEVEVVRLYHFLSESISSLEDPEKWVPHIFKRLGWSHDEFSGLLFSSFYLMSSSLKDASALPWAISGNLSSKHLELLMEEGLGDPFFGSDDLYIMKGLSCDGKSIAGSQKSRFSKEGVHYNFDILLSHDGRQNMVNIILAHLIYEKIDNIMIIIKSLVGEEYRYDKFLADF